MGEREEGYVPGPDFVEDTQEPLVDIQMNDNTELWLVQLPDDTFPDLDGFKMTLDLDEDGEIGSVKGPDGVVYSLFNFPANVAETTVFQPTPSGTKVVGKISRHVSLVHYPEPGEPGAVAAAPKRWRTTTRSDKTTAIKSQFSSPSQMTSTPTSHRGSRVRSRLSGESGRSSGVTAVSGSSELSHKKKSRTKA